MNLTQLLYSKGWSVSFLETGPAHVVIAGSREDVIGASRWVDYYLRKRYPGAGRVGEARIVQSDSLVRKWSIE